MDLASRSTMQNEAARERSEPRAGKASDTAVDLSAMHDLLIMVAHALLDRPDAVTINVKHQAEDITLVMRVPADEAVKIIGEQGRTVRSLRTFFSALSAKHETRILLEVVEV